MSPRASWSGFAGCLLGLVLSAAEPTKPVWATPTKPEWDGWVQDVAKMRAACKPQPQAPYLHAEPVVWDGYHDVNQSHLADGRILTLEWKGKEWDIIDGWEKGRKLLLCYDEADGASLLDPATKKRFLVAGIAKKAAGFVHPIDDYLKSLDANTTYEMMSACYEARRLWRLEIDRVVRKVLAMPHLPAKARDEFVELTAARVRYCELQGAVGAAAIHADIDGTAAGPLGLSYVATVYRDAYRQLADLADHFSAYDREPGK